MSETLASFRDLKGIGPATEARLHEAGIYTWEALSAAATALEAVRRNGDALRAVADMVTAQSTQAGGRGAPRLPGGERLEAFVLRLAVSANGQVQHCTATHVRSMAEKAWADWDPAELGRFIEEHSELRRAVPASPPQTGRASPQNQRPPRSPSRQARSREHVVVLDAGMAIGGTRRDIDLVVTSARTGGSDFDYRAILATRPLGSSGNGDGWAALASQAGTGHPAAELPLRFSSVQLPRGINRLQLRFEVNLPEPTNRPPKLALV